MTFRANLPYCDNEAIRQIIPAIGVDAIFENPEDGSPYSTPVICWALTDVDDHVDDNKLDEPTLYQKVQGMVLLDGAHYLDFAGNGEGIGKFIRYESSLPEQE